GAAREQHSDQAEQGSGDRLTAHCLRQVDVLQPRRVESNGNRRQREQREQDREAGPVVANPGSVVHRPRRQSRHGLFMSASQASAYCLTYGRPIAAGGIERPITPATAIRVSAYGRMLKSCGTELPGAK